MFGWKSVLSKNKTGFLLFFIISVVLAGVIRWRGTGTGLGIGDILLVCWYGSEPVVEFTLRSVLEIPGIWFFLHCYLYAAILFYPQHKLYQSDIVTIRMKSRRAWWKDIVLWLAGSECVYYGLFLLAVVLVNLDQAGTGWRPHAAGLLPGFEEAFPGISSFGFEQGYGIFWVRVLLMPVLIGITLGLFQLTLSLYIGFEWSILVSFSYFLVSLYKEDWWLIGNGTMLVRSELAGYPHQTLRIFLMCGGIILLSVWLGYWKLSRMDILQRRRS